MVYSYNGNIESDTLTHPLFIFPYTNRTYRNNVAISWRTFATNRNFPKRNICDALTQAHHEIDQNGHNINTIITRSDSVVVRCLRGVTPRPFSTSAFILYPLSKCSVFQTQSADFGSGNLCGFDGEVSIRRFRGRRHFDVWRRDRAEGFFDRRNVSDLIKALNVPVVISLSSCLCWISRCDVMWCVFSRFACSCFQ